MKTLLAIVIVMAIALPLRAQETDKERDAAIKELQTFARANGRRLMAGFKPGFGPEHKWMTFLATYETPERLWQESGYAKLMDAVKAVEADYLSAPKGRVAKAKPK